MPRFFVLPEQVRGTPPELVELTGSDVKHIRDVLRLKSGDDVIVCDSSGTEYHCVLERCSSDRVLLRVRKAHPGETEPLIPVFLYQGIPKGEKMDWIIQKTVELGVCGIVPVMTERTVVRLEQERDKHKKQERWQRIAYEAAKQCGRTLLPRVETPISFQDALARAGQGLRILPYENEAGRSLKKVLKNLPEQNKNDPIHVFIGPEGGFAQREVFLAEESGFISVTLGKRILRTETAGLAVLAAVRYEWED